MQHISYNNKILNSQSRYSCENWTQIQLQCLSTTYSSTLVTTLMSSMDSRMAKYEANEALILATALDPRFKLEWCDDSEKKQEIEKLLNIKLSTVGLSEEVGDEKEELCPPTKKVKTELFSFIASQPRKRHNSKMETNVTDYHSTPISEMGIDPLSYWEINDTNYPHLAKLAEKYLTIQASSAAVERLFSIGGRIFRTDRCRLTTKLLKD